MPPDFSSVESGLDRTLASIAELVSYVDTFREPLQSEQDLDTSWISIDLRDPRVARAIALTVTLQLLALHLLYPQVMLIVDTVAASTAAGRSVYRKLTE